MKHYFAATKTTLKPTIQILLLCMVGISCKKDNAQADIPPDVQGIAGRITDTKGVPLANVLVTITKANESQKKNTDSDGYYKFPSLLNGTYQLTATKTDFQTQYSDVNVDIGQTKTFNLQLKSELPELEITPANLNFEPTETSKTLYFKNTSSVGTISLTLDVPQKDTWLTFDHASLSIAEGASKSVNAYVDRKGKIADNYVSSIIISYAADNSGKKKSSVYEVKMVVPNPLAPSVITNKPSGVTQFSADITGEVTNIGGSSVTLRGICWSEKPEPDPTTDFKETIGGGTVGSFTLTAKNLLKDKTYFVRAFATNANGTGLGNIESFSTSLPTKLSVTIDPATNITQTTATLSGKFSISTGSTVIEQGFCWNTTGSPTTASNKIKTNVDANGAFGASLSGLSPDTKYYVRAYAINNTIGTVYSDERFFTTTKTLALPILTTSTVTVNNSTSATGGGNITSDNGSAITARGVCWSTSNNPTIDLATKTNDGTGVGKFTSILTGLSGGTYYVRAYATNGSGTAYGGEEKLVMPFAIGQNYGGGKIFYIDDTGQHGLIAATSDQSTGITWYNGSYQITGATGTAIGTGKANTKTIISVLGPGNYAANLCDKLDLNGYKDWYLPSEDELSELIDKRIYVGGFTDQYWSSSEIRVYGFSYLYGVSLSGSTGSRYDKVFIVDYKISNVKVRAIRSF